MGRHYFRTTTIYSITSTSYGDKHFSPKALYLTYIGIIPKGRHFLKYTKGKKKVQKYEDWLIDLIVQEFQCSKNQSNEYLEILYSTSEGRQNIKYICEKYGVDKKDITKLKLKV